MAANELRNFIFENYYKRIGFIKQITYYSKQRLRKRFDIACTEINRKRADPNNVKEYYYSYLKKHKTSKTIKNNFSATKIHRIQTFLA